METEILNSKPEPELEPNLEPEFEPKHTLKSEPEPEPIGLFYSHPMVLTF